MAAAESGSVGQRVAVLLSCACFAVLIVISSSLNWLRIFFLVLLCVIAPVEKLCSVMNLIAVERDWIVVIAESSSLALEILNSRMRRIDLFCKLLGPLCIALIDGASTKIAIGVVFGTNALSVFVEYVAIRWVYHDTPNLGTRASTAEDAAAGAAKRPSRVQAITCHIKKTLAEAKSYIKHDAFFPSFALSLLYFTVLSFSGQMVTFLISVNYTSTSIGLMRTAAVIFELAATWLAPTVMKRIGPVRSGLWSINWQLCCLVPSVAIFWTLIDAHMAALALVSGVILSRVGLWGFDLSIQIIVQEVSTLHLRARSIMLC